MWTGGAGYDGNITAARLWVAGGADINVVDDVGRTPLMTAVSIHEPPIVVEMLRLGANPRHVSKFGETPLHWVAWRGRDYQRSAGEVVRLLVAAGCDPAVRDNHGRTAHDLAHHPVLLGDPDGDRAGPRPGRRVDRGHPFFREVSSWGAEFGEFLAAAMGAMPAR